MSQSKQNPLAKRESPPKTKEFVLEVLLKRINTKNLFKIPSSKRLFHVLKKMKGKKPKGLKDNLCVNSNKCHNPNKIP